METKERVLKKYNCFDFLSGRFDDMGIYRDFNLVLIGGGSNLPILDRMIAYCSFQVQNSFKMDVINFLRGGGSFFR